MTTDPSRTNAIARYSELGRDKQILFLTSFGWELSILARDTYEPGTDRLLDPNRLRCINEIQHRVFGQMRNLQSNRSKRAADADVVTMLLEQVTPILREQTEYAFWRAIDGLGNQPDVDNTTN